MVFADVLIQDLHERRVPPHTAASVHLISFFKEAKQFDKGIEFWEWVSRQNDDFVDAAVYGAAIELKTEEGKVTLQELEESYAEALSRFPGSFAEYHLSPEAVVSDRGQPTTLNGLPMSLLQGIMTARINHGDWKNAYLGLDTAFRLFPTQVPTRMLELFMLERPLTESYTIFLMACRSGVVLRPDRLTALLNRLAKSQIYQPVSNQFSILEAMLNAIHAYIGAGGRAAGYHIVVFLKGVEQLLPDRPKGASDIDQVETETFVVDFARQVPALFAQAGVPIAMASFGVLLTIAGKTNRPEMVTGILKSIAETEHNIDPVIFRIALLAAGQMRNSDLVRSIWQTLAQDAESRGENLDAKDWLGLARAVRRTEQKQFIEDQLSKLGHTLTENTVERVQRALDSPEPEMRPSREQLDSTTVDIHLQQLQSRMMLVLELIQSQEVLNFYEEPLPMAIQHRSSFGSEDALRNVYDELTTNPEQPKPVEEALKPAIASTGFPLDELRFENWITINELLAEAEWHEAQRAKAVDEAIRSGRALNKERLKESLSVCFENSTNQQQKLWTGDGISEDEVHEHPGTAEDLQAIRDRISQLRRPTPREMPPFF